MNGYSIPSDIVSFVHARSDCYPSVLPRALRS